jgi:FkbM family methyltransferase
MGPRPSAVHPPLTLRYLVQAELNYLLEEAGRGGLPSIARSWARKVRETLLWRVRRGTGGGDGPVVVVPAGRLAVNPDDLGISRELLVYGSHEPASTRLLEDFLGPGMTVLDVGANLGYFVLQEKRILGDGGRIVAIEPAPRNVAVLRRNIAANRLDGVDVVEGAIGDVDGVGWLYLSDRSNWHSMTPSDRSQSDAVRVEVSRLDTLVERLGLPRIDFVRMDLEGYETSVVRGMLRTLRDFRPKLAMELHPQKAGVGPILDLLRVLRSFDYELRWVVHRRLDFSWHPGLGQAVEAMSLDEYVRSDQLLKEGRTVTAFLEPRRQEA